MKFKNIKANIIEETENKELIAQMEAYPEEICILERWQR